MDPGIEISCSVRTGNRLKCKGKALCEGGSVGGAEVASDRTFEVRGGGGAVKFGNGI